MLERGMVRVIDVAGLEGISGADEIEKKMQMGARRMVEEADFVILVREVGDERPMISLSRDADLAVRSKGDLGRAAEGEMLVSAKTQQNLDSFRRKMSEM